MPTARNGFIVILLSLAMLYGCRKTIRSPAEFGPVPQVEETSKVIPDPSRKLECVSLPDMCGIWTLISALVVDDDDVYWIDCNEEQEGTGTISRCCKQDGSPEILVGGIYDPRELTGGGDHLFYVDYGKYGDMALYSVSKTGREPRRIHKSRFISDVTYHDGFVYWVSLYTIMRARLPDGQPETVDETDDETGDILALAVDGSNVYWSAEARVGADVRDSILVRLDTEKGRRRIWDFSERLVIDIAVGDGKAYVLTDGTQDQNITEGSVLLVPVDNAPFDVLAAHLNQATQLEVAGRWLVVVTDYTILAFPTEGGAGQVIGSTGINPITVDEDSVYSFRNYPDADEVIVSSRDKECAVFDLP